MEPRRLEESAGEVRVSFGEWIKKAAADSSVIEVAMTQFLQRRVPKKEFRREVRSKDVREAAERAQPAIRFSSEEGGGAFIISRETLDFLADKAGRAEKEWVGLEQVRGLNSERAAAIESHIEDVLGDAHWRKEAGGSLKTEVVGLTGNSFLVRETFSYTGKTGQEKQPGAKFYLVKTG